MNRFIDALYRKANQVLIIAGLGVLSVIVATVGFSDWPGHFSLEPFFKAVGFLVLDGLGVAETDLAEEKFKGCLTAARILSVLTVSSATLALLWHHVGNDFILRFRRHHCVVIGAGWKGHKLLEQLAKSSPRPIAVDTLMDEGFARWCRVKGIGMVQGDATEKKNIELARVHKAKKIYIFTGNDDTNLQVANLVGEVVHDRPASKENHPLECYVELASQRNSRALSLAIGAPAQENCRHIKAQLINVENATVRALLEKHPLDRFETFAPSAPAVAHVVVVGDTPIAREIIRQAMQQAHYETDRYLHVSVLTSEPMASARSFAERYPAFKASFRVNDVVHVEPAALWVRKQHILPTVTFHPLPKFEDSLLPPPSAHTGCETLMGDITGQVRHPQAITVFVATGDTPRNLNYASCLATPLAGMLRLGTLEATVCVHITARNTGFQPALEARFKSQFPDISIVPFEDFMSDYRPANVEGHQVDERACKINQHYRTTNPSGPELSAEEAWQGLTEEEKDSNRQAASHVGVKHRLKKRLDSTSIIATLGQIEHRRWCAEKLLKGFQPLTDFPSIQGAAFTQTPKDRQAILDWFGWCTPPQTHTKKEWQKRKRHLDLVPFDAIQEIILKTGAPKAPDQAEREVLKDYEQVAFVLHQL